MSNVQSFIRRHPEARKIAFSMAVGRAIRDLREARGVTRRTLARLIGMSETQLDRVEAGEVACPHFSIREIAYELDCTVDELTPDAEPSTVLAGE